eukprot:5610183-Alexandrium_andersonii.AAC.1
MGREVHAVGVSPLQHRVVMGSLIPLSQAFIVAPKAHALQDLGGRAGPPRGLADQATPTASRRWPGKARPEPAHVPNATLHLRLTQELRHARFLP